MLIYTVSSQKALGLHPLSKYLIEPPVRLAETNCACRHLLPSKVSEYTHLFKLLCVWFVHSCESTCYGKQSTIQKMAQTRIFRSKTQYNH